MTTDRTRAGGPHRDGAVGRAGDAGDLRTAAFDASTVPLLLADADGRVLVANPTAAELAGVPAASLAGDPVWHVIAGPGHDHPGLPDALAAAFTAHEPSRRRPRQVSAEVVWTGPLGDRRRYAWTLVPLVEDDGTPGDGRATWAATGIDVTEHRRDEATWQRLAQTDPLTGLANRSLAEQVLREHLRAGHGLGCALLFCDLDGFKAVNDTHGHQVGDQLLVAVAERLTGSVRPGDVVARLGGDEFVVVLPGTGPVETRAVAMRLEHAVSRPLRIDSLAVRVGVSVGTRVAAVGEDPHLVLREADEAMYAVKSRRGRRRTAD